MPETLLAAADGPRDAHRLFMGNLPKAKTDEDIRTELGRITPALVRVITYKNFEDPSLHRGFCFLDYETAEAAADAKRLLARYTVFGCKTIVDWADPEPEIGADEMATVRILFVRQYGGVLDEERLAAVFGQHGRVERVKNLKNYAFVHFERREDAQAAMDRLDGAVDGDTDVRLTVSWAKPPADKQIRERVLRDRERRMKQTAAAVTARGSAGGCVTACRLAAGTSTVREPARPYSKYDHYEYDFGWSTADYAAVCSCQLQPFDAAYRSGRPVRCPCAASSTIVSVAAGYDDDDEDEDDDEDARPRQRYRPRPRSSDCPTSSADAGGGDCVVHGGASSAAAGSTVDENVRKFFYKITAAKVRHVGE